MSKPISQAEYLASFDGDKRKKAFEHALEIRKFEIDLYWKRATYFWTFIAATLAGYAAIHVSTNQPAKTDLLVVISCLGVVFSFGWFCVNRGSKQWQENWENHVNMLEGDIIGPLYKIMLKRQPPIGFYRHISEFITGPSPLSVSRINQIISLYVTVLWLFLLYKVLPPFSYTAPINWEFVTLIGLSLMACIGFITVGKTYGGSHESLAFQRNAEVIKPPADLVTSLGARVKDKVATAEKLKAFMLEDPVRGVNIKEFIEEGRA